MVSSLVSFGVVAAALAAAFLLGAVVAFRKRKPVGGAASLTLGALLLTLAALMGTLSVATRGYKALTREEVAAWVTTEPAGPQRFRAHVRFPDGREERFELAGDELYVDAHILKWKPLANIFGLHTAYELDRIAGRFAQLGDERSEPRTVYSLAEAKPMDLFHLRRRYRLLAPVVDAEYGSATFIAAGAGREFEIRVSTTGLLARVVGGADARR